jgi:(R)-2-hydroxyglutarate---pyruvate transhydrogenase
MKATFFVLIETMHYADFENAVNRLETFIEALLSSDSGCQDGVLATSESQFCEFWKFRELIPEACVKYGHTIYKYDVSIPTPYLYTIIDIMKERLLPRFPDTAIVGYGHAGDGNIHLNIMSITEPTPEFESLLEPYIYEQVAALSGSISAEHGLGLQKAQKILYSKPKLAVTLMHQIKELFDPNDILNPYKVLPRH